MPAMGESDRESEKKFSIATSGYRSRNRRIFSEPLQFSPVYAPECMSTGEPMTLEMPSALHAGRTKNSGDAEMTTSSSRWIPGYQLLMLHICSTQKSRSLSSIDGMRRNMRNKTCFAPVLLVRCSL